MIPARPGFYLGQNRILTVTDRGDRMYLDTRDIMITPGLLCWGSWEPETTRSFEALIKPGMVWADVGANVGYFTIIGHRLAKGNGGKTFAFEANPVTYELMADNIQLNWFFTDVVTEKKAIYSEPTTVKFSAPAKHNANASIGSFQPNEWKDANDQFISFDAEAVSLDSYFEGQKLDFIKIDIEGAEVFALRGAKKVIGSNASLRILIEWSPAQMRHCQTDPSELIAIVKAYGFRCWHAEGGRSELSYDDLAKIHDTTMVLLSRTPFSWPAV